VEALRARVGDDANAEHCRLRTALVGLVTRAEGEGPGRAFVVRDDALEAEGLGRLAEALAQRGEHAASLSALDATLASIHRASLERDRAALAWTAVARARAALGDPVGCDEALVTASHALAHATETLPRARGFYLDTLADLEHTQSLAQYLAQCAPGLPPLDATLAARRALAAALGRGDDAAVAALQQALRVCAGAEAMALGEGVEAALGGGHHACFLAALDRLTVPIERELLCADAAVVAAALGELDLAVQLAERSRDAAYAMPHRVADAFLAIGRDAVAEVMVPSTDRFPSHPLSLPHRVRLFRALQRRGAEVFAEHLALRTLWMEGHPTTQGPRNFVRLHLGCALTLVGEAEAGHAHIAAALKPLRFKLVPDRWCLTLAPPLLAQARSQAGLRAVYTKSAKSLSPVGLLELAVHAARDQDWTAALGWVARMPDLRLAQAHALALGLAAGSGLPEPRLGLW